ncbi:unnamed protein product [Heterosigma akashiwo]|mmetsp:Transcript_45177/g.102295  ORF Transcript_45177/g.102295 Transcript_45177/m.102295 type:complete len:181 (-) Transcript_45177:144-686(-)
MGGESDIEVLFRKGEQDFKLKINQNDAVSSVKDNLLSSEHFGSSSGQAVRLFFKGQELSNERNISTYGIEDGSIIHAVVKANSAASSQAAHQNSTPTGTNGPLTLENKILIGVVGGGLLAFWVLRFKYDQYFNMLSTLILVFLTGIFGLGVHDALVPPLSPDSSVSSGSSTSANSHPHAD